MLVWKVDRLARRVLDFLHANQALEARGAAVAAVADPIDMSTPQGKAFATMLAVFAEMEAEAIRARVKAARAALIKTGRVAGGAAPFGYYNAPNPEGPGKVLAKNPETIAFVIEAAGRALRGDSIHSVAAYLDEKAPRKGRKNSAAHWTITVTKRMLSNPVLAGMTLHNPGNQGKERGKEVLRDEDGMPIIREDLAVLSVEEFRQLQSRLASKQPQKASTESYLAGLVWCGDCNRKMYRNAKTVHGKKVRVFQCQGKSGCGQQVTNLEATVEERFLSEYGTAMFMRLVRTTDPDALAQTEIGRQIEETLEAFRDANADIPKLSTQLQTLRELQARTPEAKYRRELSEFTVGDVWQTDPREALTERFEGVRLVKGGKGRKFDQARLSFIERPAFEVKTVGRKHKIRIHREP